MKTRNKKRLGIIVASFLTVLLVGSAFAFVMSQDLRLNGRMHVSAELMIAFETAQTPSGGTQAGVADWTVGFDNHVVMPTYAKITNIAVNFLDDGTVEIPFTIKNIGTVAAETTAIFPFFVDNPLLPYLTWSHTGFVRTVLAPGDSYDGMLTFVLDTSAIDYTNYLQGYAEFVFKIEYARP